MSTNPGNIVKWPHDKSKSLLESSLMRSSVAVPVILRSLTRSNRWPSHLDSLHGGVVGARLAVHVKHARLVLL